MLFRHILGYAPSNLIPATVSFLTIYVFTRLLLPENYGVYALVFNVAFIAQGIVSFWLRNGAIRFYDNAEAAGTLRTLISTIYAGYVASMLIFSLVYALAMLTLPISDPLRQALWIGLPFILCKGLVTVNLAIHRGAMRIARYNLLECGQTVLGLLFAICLVRFGGMKQEGVLLGLVAGSLVSVLADVPFIVRSVRAPFSREQMRELLVFGMPLTVSVILNLVLSSSDRILVQYFLGSAPVGIYSVSYGIMNQPMMLVFLAVSMPGLPLAVRALETRGRRAAEAQMYRNGTALLALGVPACAGLILVSEHLATVLIGPEFRTEALKIMPWIAVAATLAGFQAHYFDHAFTLGKKPKMLIRSIGIAAAVNVALNLVLLPWIGLMGAVYSTFASYVVAIAGSLYYGRDVFRVPFPFKEAVLTVVATVPMWIVLSTLRFPDTMLGLLTMVIVGAGCYALSATALNLCDARTKLWQRFLRRATI
ncbi:MAG: oligosaccharide flippase family protein [Burkholderiaceae bacterium]